MTPLPRRGAHTDPDVREAIEDLARAGYKAPTIKRTLMEDEDLKPRVPWSLRTIQAIAQKARRDPDRRWRLGPENAEDAALLLPVIVACIEFSEGQVRWLTTGEAEIALMILRAAPDIPPREVRRLMWQFAGDEERNGVENFLAFAPWRSEEAAERYRQAFAAGWIDHFLHPGRNSAIRRTAQESAKRRAARARSQEQRS